MAEKFFNEAFLRKLERLALLTRRAAAGQLQGERRSSKRGQSVEFADFRPDVSGDDFRRIDWNAYARLERFFIKLFIEEQDLTVHFLVDASRSMDWGQPNKLEYAAHAAGALGYVALVGLDRVLVTALAGGKNGADKRLPAIRGKKQALMLFDFLGSLASPGQLQSRRDTKYQLTSYAANAGRPGPLMVLSDLMDEGWMEGLNILAGRGFEITVVHILSPDEVTPELAGDFKLIDSENGSGIEVTADFEMLERYRRGLIDWREKWHRFCGARGMHYVPIDTSIPLENLLFTWLRQQGVLR